MKAPISSAPGFATDGESMDEALGYARALLGAMFCLVPCWPASAQVVQEPARVIAVHQLHTGSYSASSDGGVLALQTSPRGQSVLLIKGKTVQLPPLEESDVLSKESASTETIQVNGDGKVVFHRSPGALAIWKVPDGSLLWRGSFASDSGALFLNLEQRRLRVASTSGIEEFELTGASSMKRVGRQTLDLAGAGGTAYPQVLAPTFSGDGDLLFLATNLGELIAVRVAGAEPTLVWKSRLPWMKAPIAGIHASRINCVEGCDRIVVRDRRSTAAAVFSGKDGKLLGAVDGRAPPTGAPAPDDMIELHGISGGKYILSRRKGMEMPRISVVDDQLRLIGGIAISPPRETTLIGFNGGWASMVADSPREVRLSFLDLMVESFAKQKRESEDAAERAAQASAASAAQAKKAEEEREALERQAARVAAAMQERLARDRLERLAKFRASLKSGDESHCGLVVERKGEIAQVETMIGLKWVRLAQLHIPGSQSCSFVNGVLVD